MNSKKYIFLTLILSLFISVQNDFLAQVLTQSDTTISNFAKGNYEDKEGELYETVSETVEVKVVPISSLVVTPNESSPSEVVAPNETIERPFKICNTSNADDSYTITELAVTPPAEVKGIFYDADDNGVISADDVAINVNTPLSNLVSPGSCIRVLVKIDTNDISPKEDLNIKLTARSNNKDAVNGQAEDSGEILNTGGNPAKLTDPNDPTLIPSKLIENKASYVSSKNQPLEYKISFRNSGDVDARNVVMTDDLPEQLAYIPDTLKVDGFAVTDKEDSDQGSVVGRRVSVKLQKLLKPGEMIVVTFKAKVAINDTPGEGIINVAKVSADNAVTEDTTQAVAIIDPFGTVFAARGGASSPISGARVTILTDSSSGRVLNIPVLNGNGFEPNFNNENPYLTNQEGRFAFAMSPDQLGTVSNPATYVVSVSADGFRSRLIQITLSPNGNGLFKMIVRSLDGMPVAVADGFELTDSEVLISSIADIAFNIPMFERSTLEVTKTADRQQADIGDIINYRVEVGNSSVVRVLDVLLKDTLPDSFSYVENTAQIEKGGSTTPIKPSINGKVLTFNLGDLESGERVSITYRVRIGVNSKDGDNYNTATASGEFPSGEQISSPTSRALVRVGKGLFSMRQFIIGRVYVDKNQNNFFDKGENPVVGARVYLANGNSAVTDSQGMYSIPSVSQGSQVITLDPVSIPSGYALTDGGSRAGKDWTRLLRTPLGGGGMLRQNFALVEFKGSGIKENKTLVKTKVDKSAVLKKAPNKEESEAIVFKTVKPGDLEIHNVSDGKVASSTALNLDVSVAKDWKTQIEINGKSVGEENIGKTRQDSKNKITTYTFVSLGLKPGPNKLRVTAVNSNGERGKSVELKVYGRGPAKRLEMFMERKNLQASGRDSTVILIQAFDQWENPAQDTSVMVKTTAGRLVLPEEDSSKAKSGDSEKILRSDLLPTNGETSEQVNETSYEQLVNIVDGIGAVRLISPNKKGKATITAIQGKNEISEQIIFTSELRPEFLSGVAELTVGKNAPEMINRNLEESVRGRIQFFYKGSIFGEKNRLTLAYDSQDPLNRIAGQDRLFQLNPLDHVYPLFGDSSTRFQETESNSKVYARFDRGRSHAMFGDFQANMQESRLIGYSRKLTGAKIHLENNKGDYVTVTGARPDTSFARQVIPGGTIGLVQLAFPNVLPGSEVLSLEVRDRRNPELILSREILNRSVDYNIDTSTGTIFFLRQISAFDRELNLIQVVATYEYESEGMESTIYTARASKSFNRLGLRLGFSYIHQKQNDASPFQLGGIDASLKLPNRGNLTFEWARSNGSLSGGFGFINNNPNGSNEYNGDALFLSIQQPLPKIGSLLKFEGNYASRNFYNPFGATVTPGSTRGVLTFETKPLKNSTLQVNLIGEKNLTDNVDNNRITAGVKWSQTVNERLRFDFGYDFRKFTDNLNDKTVSSNLITAGVNFRPIKKLDLSIRREQNLGDEDQSYPNQTLISADYQVSQYAKVFFTQRLSSNTIRPISDVTGTGFAQSNARNETAIGVETQFGKYTSFSGRYQIENGINGTDSFSIIGIKNRLPVAKTLALEVGYERAFHLAGNGQSYNNFTLGANWLPSDSFRSSFRYELRDRDGFGQLFSIGVAGQFKPGWTTLGRFQYGDIDYNGRKNLVKNGQVALAIRPHDTDKYGFLFSYKHRESFFTQEGENPTELKTDLLSTDAFYQPTQRLELYGRFALKYTADGNPALPFASNTTLLTQGRAQYRINRWLDIAGEGRYLYQPSTGSQSRWLGAEAGFWVTPELRLGGGYNFSRSEDVYGFNNNNVFNRNGFYFTISTKLSRLFNLFGTSKKGLHHFEKENNKNNHKDISKNNRK